MLALIDFCPPVNPVGIQGSLTPQCLSVNTSVHYVEENTKVANMMLACAFWELRPHRPPFGEPFSHKIKMEFAWEQVQKEKGVREKEMCGREECLWGRKM